MTVGDALFGLAVFAALAFGLAVVRWLERQVCGHDEVARRQR